MSRAWRKSAGWLNDLRHAKNQRQKDTARWKIFNHQHPEPDKAQANPQQLAAMTLEVDDVSTSYEVMHNIVAASVKDWDDDLKAADTQ